jgi:hypothetical protein
MYQQKKQRDYRSLWIISLIIIVLGVVFTIRLAMIRPLGFVLLGVGGFGLIWALANMDKWKDRQDKDDRRQFN